MSVSQGGSNGPFWQGWDLSGNAFAFGVACDAAGTLDSPAGTSSLVPLFCFRSSGGTRGAGSCRWPVSCLSWKNIPRRPDGGSPGLGTAGKETTGETAGSRVEIGDFNTALDEPLLQIMGLS